MWWVSNDLGHKPGHDVQVNCKGDIINEELGQSTYDNLPDIAGYDNIRDANGLKNRIINKNRFTGHYRITDSIRKSSRLITPFDKEIKRVTVKTAQARNNLMIDLADSITVGYISEGGLLEELLKQTNKNIMKIE